MLAAFVARPAIADERADPAKVERARSHFEAGRALFSLGSYQDALREFVAGYQLVPRPQFLLNLGQTYRKLDNPAKAREMYERFLEEAPPGDPDRPVVTEILAELRATPAAPPSPQPSAQPSASPAAVAASPAPATAVKKSFIKRHWWIIPVAAVAVAGIAVGIYFGVKGTGGGVDCGRDFGCVQLTP